MLRRGEIHRGSVPPDHTVGSEQHDHDGVVGRPYLIVSDGRLESRLEVVVACPLSTSVRADPAAAPFRLELTPDMVDRTPDDVRDLKPTTVLCDQIRVMSVDRFRTPSRVGKLKPALMAQIESRLQALLNLS